MMVTKELRLEIEAIQSSDLQDRAELLSEWLRFDKKETFDEILEFVCLQNDLIDNLTRELADLRKQESPIEQKFFPMSYTPKKRF
jgi:hypothetical protein